MYLHIILRGSPEAVSSPDLEHETRKQRVQERIPSTASPDRLQAVKAPTHPYIDDYEELADSSYVFCIKETLTKAGLCIATLSVLEPDRLWRVEPDVGLVTILWQMLIDGDSSIETSCQHEMFS